MPVEKVPYEPSFLFRNGDVNTIFASLFRKIQLATTAEAVRLETPDNDFVDLDIYRNDAKRVLIISHGLEGNSQRPYVLGMAKQALLQGWDVIAWNFRGCSGEPNRKLTNYHSGSTSDLALVCDYADRMGYDEIGLCGFSIGGNKTLLLASRDRTKLNSKAIGAVAYSVPCDLVSSSYQLALPKNRIYMRNFLSTLRAKLEEKKSMYPGCVDLSDYQNIQTFEEFDGRYTAPMNGFKNAVDYWSKSSSLPHLEKLQVPTALISSKDDPFLTDQCFPYAQAEASSVFHLCLTERGGHVGFARGLFTTSLRPLVSELRGLEFLEQQSSYSITEVEGFPE